METERRILADELDVGIVTGTLATPANLKIFHLLTDEFVFHYSASSSAGQAPYGIAEANRQGALDSERKDH